MAQANKVCEICGTLGHSKFYCKNRPIKPKKPVVRKNRITQKPKKLSRSKIKKTLDKLVKDYVKERDNYTCQKCGKKVEGSDCHASHIFPVGRCSILEFEPLNMKVLCMSCHLWWWHKNPVEAAAWIEFKFPDRVAILNIMKTVKVKTSTVDLQVLIDGYKQKLQK